MFFMMGITDGRKELNYSQMEICSVRGCLGRYKVLMTYTFFLLFFIPLPLNHETSAAAFSAGLNLY